MTESIILLILVDAAMFLQLFGLWIAVMMDRYIEKRRRRLMFLVMAVLILIIVHGHLDYYIVGYDFSNLTVTSVSTLGYIARPVILALFISIQNNNRKLWPIWLIVGMNTAIHLISIPFGWVVDFYSLGSFQRGPLYFTGFITNGILILYLIIMGLHDFRITHARDRIIPIFVSGTIVFSVFVDLQMEIDLPVSFLTMSMVVACVFYYLWLHVHFLNAHEKELEDGQRIQIMISQIQPHFLFNTLSTVQSLCRTDPDMASTTLERFGVYLRQNLDSLDSPDLIPFSRELEHTRIYTDIERIRFPHIVVNYEIDTEDFLIPALTIQPLVENAIKYGVRVRDHGIIDVIVKRMDSRIQIYINDNGKGFDVNAPVKDDSRSHIGLKNVRERIVSMCAGDMMIDSRIDEGTRITITLPM